MKASDITKPSDKTLMEQIERNPIPGFKNDDMFRAAKALRDDDFDEGVPIEEFGRMLEEQIAALKNGSNS